MRFEAQKAVPVVYKSTRLAAMLRIDLLVEDSVVVEVKVAGLPAAGAPGPGPDLLADHGLPGGPALELQCAEAGDGVRSLLNSPRPKRTVPETAQGNEEESDQRRERK